MICTIVQRRVLIKDFPWLVVLGGKQPIRAEDEGEDEPEVEGVEGHGVDIS